MINQWHAPTRLPEQSLNSLLSSTAYNINTMSNGVHTFMLEGFHIGVTSWLTKSMSRQSMLYKLSCIFFLRTLHPTKYG